MKVLAFGIVKEIMGGASIAVPVDANVTVAALQASLEQQYPRLKQLAAFMIAVNGEYAKPDMIVKPGDEVAIIPPVSGG